jgi:hypothetical protein
MFAGIEPSVNDGSFAFATRLSSDSKRPMNDSTAIPFDSHLWETLTE